MTFFWSELIAIIFIIALFIWLIVLTLKILNIEKKKLSKKKQKNEDKGFEIKPEENQNNQANDDPEIQQLLLEEQDRNKEQIALDVGQNILKKKQQINQNSQNKEIKSQFQNLQEIELLDQKIQIDKLQKQLENLQELIQSLQVDKNQYETLNKQILDIKALIKIQNIHNYSQHLSDIHARLTYIEKNLYQQQDIGDIILPLYEKTSKKRQIEDQYKYYVRQLKNKVDLKKNYSLSLQANQEMGNYCNAFKEVRGDGNCFYTAFGYQFLSILLFDYSIDQFYKFIEKIKQINLPMKIYVTGQDFKIDDKQLEEKLLKEFLNRLMKLKQIQDLVQRKEQFHNQFAAYEKQSEEVDACLYGLSTIFFRNYSNYIVDFSEKKDALYDRENLLKWEEECNSNEVIIAELAKQLNIFVQLIFIENKDQLKKFQYGNEQHNKIILLIKPGHYNIGYFIQETINMANSFEKPQQYDQDKQSNNELDSQKQEEYK
ncbi:unnamed protein product [Paramecium sonneborni]|uniref:OTU domain-containing protein n=1 Tax=Paramecium sonneborni TaxID=65129 RepID=A0A8S1RLA1_9CILI|nr:unnamed protein product [Paramecium sonneborni]